MPRRTFGWIQDAYDIDNLKKVISVFKNTSDENKLLRTDKLPRLIKKKELKKHMLLHLSKNSISIPYGLLKGKGAEPGQSRTTAECSGIIQAILPGQRREYQTDWSADSYLRWAISLGYLEYDRETDECSISKLGEKFISKNMNDQEEAIINGFLSYPAVCRILTLLENGAHLTKFELGEQLGFIGENGFTSISLNLFLIGLENSDDKVKYKSNVEGTSDKYVRTICSWLISLGWITKEDKTVSASIDGGIREYILSQAYKITPLGKQMINHIKGTSRYRKVNKRVMWDMLATKTLDVEYVRNRRTYILQFLKTGKKIEEIVKLLNAKNITEDATTIKDDIEGLRKIGLYIAKTGEVYKLIDKIEGLSIPTDMVNRSLHKSDLSIVKDNVRKKLLNIDHKYLALIDLGFDSSANRDYEFQTAELLTSELSFSGGRLGDSRKPDVCVYISDKGLIIDNKAYSRGYSIPISQADEMVRYIEENKSRDSRTNPNKWWEVYSPNVTKFAFSFISGEFTGRYDERLINIKNRTGYNGSVINSVNLLLVAEEIKAGRMSYDECFNNFSSMSEIII